MKPERAWLTSLLHFALAPAMLFRRQHLWDSVRPRGTDGPPKNSPRGALPGWDGIVANRPGQGPALLGRPPPCDIARRSIRLARLPCHPSTRISTRLHAPPPPEQDHIKRRATIRLKGRAEVLQSSAPEHPHGNSFDADAFPKSFLDILACGRAQPSSAGSTSLVKRSSWASWSSPTNRMQRSLTPAAAYVPSASMTAPAGPRPIVPRWWTPPP